MYKSKIMGYIEETSPKIAAQNNSKYVIDVILKEINEELTSLKGVIETAKLCEMNELADELKNEAIFMAKWWVEFNKEYKKRWGI